MKKHYYKVEISVRLNSYKEKSYIFVIDGEHAYRYKEDAKNVTYINFKEITHSEFLALSVLCHETIIKFWNDQKAA